MTKLVVTIDQLRNLLRDTVLMDREYRDLHGYSADNSIHAAIDETVEGLDAEIQLAKNGEIKLESCSVIPSIEEFEENVMCRKLTYGESLVFERLTAV